MSGALLAVGFLKWVKLVVYGLLLVSWPAWLFFTWRNGRRSPKTGDDYLRESRGLGN